MSHVNLETDFPGTAPPLVDLTTGRITETWFNFLLVLWLRTGESLGDTVVPTGIIAGWPAPEVDIPTGWLLCDGSAVSRTVYANLFDVLGTTWGVGDGSTTFNLPESPGFFADADGLGVALAATGGSSTASLTTNELPAHSHAVTDPGHTHAVTDPGHAHNTSGGVAASNVTAGAAAGGSTSGNTDSATTGLTVDSATTGISTQNTGSGAAFSILPPYAALYWIIKT